MSIIFSRECEYALQAVMYLAVKQPGDIVSIKDLTEKLDIPFHFLAKILQDLTHKGLLVSHKGPAGGFGLARPAQRITLLQIIEAIDGDKFMHDCVLGYAQCSQDNQCALHEQWAQSRESIVAMLSGKNIAEMGERTKKPQYQAGN